MTTYSSFSDIPELVPVEEMPPVRTGLDVYHVWRLLMGPLGFGRRRLWVTFTDMDGRVSPVVQQIEDVPPRAGAAECDGLMTVLDHVRPFFDGGAVALLYTRPGGRPMHDDTGAGPEVSLRRLGPPRSRSGRSTSPMTRSCWCSPRTIWRPPAEDEEPRVPVP